MKLKSQGKKQKTKGKVNIGFTTTQILAQQHEINYTESVNPSNVKMKVTQSHYPVYVSIMPLDDYVYTIDGFLSQNECVQWIRFGESFGFEHCFQPESSGYAHREQGRLQFEDRGIGAAIYNRVFPFLPTLVDGRRPCCCSSNIRMYKYSVGQRFGKHIDESNPDEKTGGITLFTLLIYLNGGDQSNIPEFLPIDEYGDTLTGGETLFYRGHGRLSSVAVSVSPQQGLLLLHGHGHRCLSHEGAVVTSGTKYVLRTDVVYL